MALKTKIEEKVSIKAPPGKIFEFLTNPNKIPLVLPSLVENKKVPKLPLTKGSSFDYVYQMYGVKLKGTWNVEKINSETLSYHATTTGDVKSDWIYEIKVKGSTTLVELIIQYEIPKGVLEKVEQSIVSKVNETEAKHYLQNLKTALEF